MKKLVMVALAAGVAVAAPASAQVVYSNNFDNENGGQTALGYSGFNGLTVSRQSVDLTRSGDFYPCAGGTGACVDLDGTSNSGGELETSSAYAFNAGDRVMLTFDLSGSQRGDGANPFDAGFRFATATGLLSFTTGGAYGDSTVFNVAPLTQTVYGGTSNASDPFQTFSLSFRAATAGSVKAYIGTGSNDNIGPVLDNVSLSIAAVPEPASWAMMIGGFGFVGGTLRRRRSSLAIA